MAKARKETKNATPKAPELPPLSRIQQRVMAYVPNSVAFGNYGDCCSVDDMAERFERTPGRFLLVLRRLEAKGYLTISGRTLQWVYPTVQALRPQDPRLSEEDAK